MAAKLTPQQFVDQWKYSQLNERSAYQQHFIGLCQIIGHPTPIEMDHQGSFFRFEAGASKVNGGEGFADVWYRGHFAWEYKGKHANLDKAYQQLLQYREDLENPPLLIVSDTDQIIIHTNFTNTVKRKVVIPLEELLTSKGQNHLKDVFYNPDAFRVDRTAEDVTKKAAAKFARLAEILRADGHEPRDAAHFLIRMLFCLFAEDTMLLPNRVLTQTAINFRNNPAYFTRQLSALFAAMSTGGGFGMEMIEHFDGHLFDDGKALELGKAGLEVLVDVGDLDWGSIEPAIFGTLFERSLDPSKRSQLGAHYTSKEDILLIVEPVLMAPLRRQWQEVQKQALALAAERDAAAGRKRGSLQDKLNELLTGFSDQIAAIQVLDPACGSGNFLYLALRQLLDLWKEVTDFMSEKIGLQRPGIQIGPSPTQLHGIELNEYAHQLAQTAIQIGQHAFQGNPGRLLVFADQMTAFLTQNIFPVPCIQLFEHLHRAKFRVSQHQHVCIQGQQFVNVAQQGQLSSGGAVSAAAAYPHPHQWNGAMTIRQADHQKLMTKSNLTAIHDQTIFSTGSLCQKPLHNRHQAPFWHF